MLITAASAPAIAPSNTASASTAQAGSLGGACAAPGGRSGADSRGGLASSPDAWARNAADNFRPTGSPVTTAIRWVEVGAVPPLWPQELSSNRWRASSARLALDLTVPRLTPVAVAISASLIPP